MVLWRLSVREVLSRPGRALLTLTSIVIGVAAVVSISITTTATRLAYREMFATVTGRAELEVTAEGGGSFAETVAGIVAGVPGVRATVPVLQRHTVMHVQRRKVQLVALGIDPARDEAVRDYELAEGRFFTGDSGALLEAGFAQSMGIRPGDEVRLLTRRGLWGVRVDGLLRAQGAGSLYLGGLVFLPLKEAQRAFAVRGEVDMVQVVLDDDAGSAAVLAEIEKRLPEGVRAGRPAAQTRLVEETLESSNQSLRLATAFSLLLATFIILNTFLMNVTERRRQLALLRTIGALRGQISRLILGESLVLGSLGTLLGIFAGIAGGRLLTKTLDGLLLVSLPAPSITPAAVVLAVGFGLGISLLGAWLPARRAARLSPIEGISGIAHESMEGTSLRFTVAGGAIFAGSAAVIAISISGWLPIELAILGSVSLLVGIVLVIPAALDALLRLFARRFSARMAVEVRLAHRQIPRHHARSALTVGVLFVASSTGIGIANSVLDSMQDVRGWYRRSIVGDFFVRAMMPDVTTGISADLPEALGNEIRAVPGITNIDTLRFMQATAAGQQAVVIVRQFTSDAQAYFDLKSGDPNQVRAQLLQGEVVIGTVLAQRAGLKAGDNIVIDTLKGPRQFRIAGTTNEYLVAGLAVYMARPVAREWLGVEGVDGYVLQARPEARAEVQAQLQALSDKYGVLLHSLADIRRLIEEMMIEVDACLWGILALGFVVAAFGVVNTLTMNVLEQTREFALLRVIAMTRRQVRKTIFSQAALLGLAGLGPGTLAGLLAAYLIHLATMPATGHPVEFGFHPVLLAGSFAGALLLVLAAAGLPAERAARLDLVNALKYE